MEFTPDSSFSSAECSFNDPLLFGDEDAYSGKAPIWSWDAAVDGVLDGPQVNTSYLLSFQAPGSQQHSRCSGLDSSPFSEDTPSSSGFSEAAYAQDWSLLDSRAMFPPLPNYSAQSLQIQPTPVTPPVPLATQPYLQQQTTSYSSPSRIGAQRLPRVPIQRQQSRHQPKASSSKSSSPSLSSASSPHSTAIGSTRHHCTMSRCGRSFTRQSDLHRHNLDVHSRSGKHYECDVSTCYYSSRRSDKVKEHCQKMHQQTRGLERYTMVVDVP